MTIEKLLQLYPTGYLAKAPADSRFLSLLINEQYFIIEKKYISAREYQLLETLFEQPFTQADEPKSAWYAYLFHNQPLTIAGTYRSLQIQISATTDFLRAEWETAVKEMFPHYVDFFCINHDEYVLVEKYTKNHYSLAELQGVFWTLDTDFDSQSFVFVGSFYACQQPIAELFQEERQIFHEEAQQVPGKNIFCLTDVTLHYFTKKALAESQISESFREKLTQHNDIQPIVQALWQNQGNISSAAKSLFMHRNTLHYRIEKFYEQTGLSLKKMDDLIFCYLLLTK
jgi:hypothetical protein